MKDVDVAIAVAEAGAAVVRRRFGTKLQHLHKGAGDFATDVDIQAEDAMRAVLGLECPHDAILGEEGGGTGASVGGRLWLLDPLCGTLNYSVRMQVAGVNVALRVAGRDLAAAVADPFGQEVFWANSASAFVRADGRDTPLAPSASSGLVELNFDPPFPEAPPFRAAILLADPHFANRFRTRVVSTSLALVWVATGQRAAYVSHGDLRDTVHFAAGLAVCEAAGCTVTDLWGRPLTNGPTGLIAAADGETHAVLLGLVRKQLTEYGA